MNSGENEKPLFLSKKDEKKLIQEQGKKKKKKTLISLLLCPFVKNNRLIDTTHLFVTGNRPVAKTQ